MTLTPKRPPGRPPKPGGAKSQSECDRGYRTTHAAVMLPRDVISALDVLAARHNLPSRVAALRMLLAR